MGVWAAAVAVAVVAVAGCGGDDGGGEGGRPSASASSSVAPAPGVDEALAAYQRAAGAGCTDAYDCQDQMSAKLAAAADLRRALEAEDAAGYAVPIADIRRAERLADHYGRGNLGVRGNALAVDRPLRDAVEWLATNR